MRRSVKFTLMAAFVLIALGGLAGSVSGSADEVGDLTAEPMQDEWCETDVGCGNSLVAPSDSIVSTPMQDEWCETDVGCGNSLVAPSDSITVMPLQDEWCEPNNITC